MSTAIKRIEQILTSEFEMNSYVELVREIFSSVNLVAPGKMRPEYTNFSSHVVGNYHVGTYETPDSEKIAIFAVELKQQTYVENSRSTQRSYAKKLIENGGCDAALIAFYTPGDKDKKWRLSFVVLDYEMKIENGKMKTEEKITPARRYSYLVGKGEPCHTAISRFGKFIRDNNSQPTLGEMEDAFSVEAVTKEFFNLYCEKFYQLVEFLESNTAFIDESKRCGFSTEQFAKKLMGQIVFLYFLQKKGWLGVGVWTPLISEKEYNNIYWCKSASAAQRQIVQQYLPSIYREGPEGYKFKGLSALESIPNDAEELIANNMPGSRNWGTGSKTFLRTWFDFARKHNGHFYDNYLEPLFYDTLNKNRGELGYSSVLHCRIPFLSGGLFEPIDGYDWEHTDFDIPDYIFSNKKSEDDLNADGILDIFDRYNFTMSEDEPMEREVAIDPEMLGKVFENLLDEDHRKAKGAFYTPREVVHYMCQECLINYLVSKSDITEYAIRNFILFGDFYKDIDTEKTLRVADNSGRVHYEFDKDRELKISPEIFDPKNGVNRIYEIDDLLKNIRVADPAVGSGAFPLGMLNEIVRARQNLSAYMATTMNSNSARLMYVNERSAHSLKYETIKNCIFAADIEPSAVDIAQLRLWLALVIDDEINPDAATVLDGHKNPLPLPNLECNIICGNSLIDEFEGHNLVIQSEILGTEYHGEEYSWSQNELELLIPKLVEAQDKLFRCDNPIVKNEIKREIIEIKDRMMRTELAAMPSIVLEQYEKSKTRPSKPYVVWQTDFSRVFKEKKGFDVVIGNPPYLKELDYKEVFEAVNVTKFGEKYSDGKMNFWYYFFHKGMDILNNTGILSFIAPNYFVAGSGAAKLNNRLVNDCTIKQYVDFNKTKVFETADVQCMILVVSKEKPLTPKPFKAFMFRQKVDREKLPGIMGAIEASEDVECYVVDNQHDILLDDFKINFENAKYASLLGKIEEQKSSIALFKSTQGIVENPSFLNKKNIASIEKIGFDVSEYYPGQSVFVIPKDSIDEYNFSDDEKCFLREYHEPNEVNRYYCSDSFHNYLLYITRETMDDINQYPNIKNHLIRFKPFMEQRRETQKGTIKWFQLHWPRKEELFKGEKIVYPQMGAVPTFAYSNEPYFTNMSANIVYAICEIDLKVLTAVLNSSLAHFWLLHRAKNRGVGLDIAVSVVDKFPVNESILSDSELKKYAEEAINRAKNHEDYAAIDKMINERVYQLYKITNDEQNIIENYIEGRITK